MYKDYKDVERVIARAIEGYVSPPATDMFRRQDHPKAQEILAALKGNGYLLGHADSSHLRIPVRLTMREWEEVMWIEDNAVYFHCFSVRHYYASGPWDGFQTHIEITVPGWRSYTRDKWKDKVKVFGPNKNCQRTYDNALKYLVGEGLLEIIEGPPEEHGEDR